MNLKRQFAALTLAAALAVGGASVAEADTFGTRSNGASTVEVLQVRYDGAAWNYSGSGYKNAWFKYSRNGRTLLTKTAFNGRVASSVWDNLFDWSSNQTTRFNWGRSR